MAENQICNRDNFGQLKTSYICIKMKFMTIQKPKSSGSPNNYPMIMVSHTFSKLYITTLHLKVIKGA
jgi:hypothetical protein